jgi:nucleotide-binding universal stress UspA family protein
MKKVLIALDYNPTAQKVAETGYSLARTMRAEVVLLHVINEPDYYSAFDYAPIMGFTGYLNADLLKIADPEELEQTTFEFLNKTKNHLNDERIKTAVVEGSTSESIIRAANELSADIIVMGSHSRRWLEKILIGSVTEEVLRHSPVPLFIVPIKDR